MTKVITYKKLKNETETIMGYGDILNIIEENLGSELVKALLDFSIEEDKEKAKERPNVIDFIEDGIFEEQIRESGLIEYLVENIILDLDDQGYLKKNKSINKFIPNDEELIQFIDEKLSSGIMNYFE